MLHFHLLVQFMAISTFHNCLPHSYQYFLVFVICYLIIYFCIRVVLQFTLITFPPINLILSHCMAYQIMNLECGSIEVNWCLGLPTTWKSFTYLFTDRSYVHMVRNFQTTLLVVRKRN